jgi:hypothetical protein
MKAMIGSTVPSHEEIETFTVLVLRYLDGASVGEENQRLKDAISTNAWYRERFVKVCRMQGNLHEAFAHQRAQLHQKVPAEAVTAAAMAASQSFLSSGISQEPEIEAPAPARNPADSTIIREVSCEDTLHPPSTEPKK